MDAPTPTQGRVTQCSQTGREGDVEARDRLFELVHPELQRLAAAAAKHERPDHTLDPPALVNELFLRLSVSAQLTVDDRVHFFALAARTMRRILIDHARACV